MYQRSSHSNQKLDDEFGKIAQAINFPVDAIRLDNRGAELSKPRVGDISYANGSTWNPGYGAGIYVYTGVSYLPISGSSTYTPTLTNFTNISSSNPYICSFTRAGNLVTVSGKVDTTTAAAGASVLFMSLPVSSAMTAEENLAGIAATGSTTAAIKADFASDRAQLIFTAAGAGSQSWFFNFTYQVL